MLSLRFATLYTSFAPGCWTNAMAQIGESSTGASLVQRDPEPPRLEKIQRITCINRSTPENYRETWSSTMRFSALHHILETHTQVDFATDRLNAQKAREAARGHPW
ncbi:hypothetical protein EDB86DRAFT_2906593 [Lactarius hatsudake]|nr:hypothetical protein EDB86DRAFT_2906593 [Lactarius hatsudake]